MQRAAAAFRAIDRDGVPFDKGRAEERKALNVIPVRMSEENVRVNGFLALGHQRGGQPVRAGAAVKNQKVAVDGGQLDAGGIAAEVVRARPGSGDRPPRSPETYSHESAAPLGEASSTEDDPNHYGLYRLFTIARFRSRSALGRVDGFFIDE